MVMVPGVASFCVATIGSPFIYPALHVGWWIGSSTEREASGEGANAMRKGAKATAVVQPLKLRGKSVTQARVRVYFCLFVCTCGGSDDNTPPSIQWQRLMMAEYKTQHPKNGRQLEC